MREEEGNGATHPRGREGRSPHMQRRNQGPPPPKFLLKQRNAKGPLESAKHLRVPSQRQRTELVDDAGALCLSQEGEAHLWVPGVEPRRWVGPLTGVFSHIILDWEGEVDRLFGHRRTSKLQYLQCFFSISCITRNTLMHQS